MEERAEALRQAEPVQRDQHVIVSLVIAVVGCAIFVALGFSPYICVPIMAVWGLFCGPIVHQRFMAWCRRREVDRFERDIRAGKGVVRR